MELSFEEARVLGCLIEKEFTRPDDYPLTLNGLVAACNQTTNRDPVVSYDELTVERALAGLRDKELARRGVYAGSRVPKHRHAADERFTLSSGELAVIALLLLRGPQTPGEVKARTERMHPFDSIGAVAEVIDSLAGRESPLVVRLARRPGQKEGRVATLLSGPVPAEVEGGSGEHLSLAHDSSSEYGELAAEVAALRDAVDELRETVRALGERIDAN